MRELGQGRWGTCVINKRTWVIGLSRVSREAGGNTKRLRKPGDERHKHKRKGGPTAKPYAVLPGGLSLALLGLRPMSTPTRNRV